MRNNCLLKRVPSNLFSDNKHTQQHTQQQFPDDDDDLEFDSSALDIPAIRRPQFARDARERPQRHL